MKKAAFLFIAISLLVGCSLREKVLDTPVGANALQDSSASEEALAPVYAAYRDLYGVQDELLNLQSIASDEGIVPFRGGTDWYDGGRYIEMQQHTWTPTSVSVTKVWQNLTKAIAKAAYAEKVINSKSNQPNSKQLYAEAQAMGAYWNQLLLDLYGVAAEKKPEDVGTDNLSKIYRGKDAVNYILSQYDAALPNLPDKAQVGNTHFTKAADWALKARLFLNKPVYVNEYASQFDFTKQDMDSVIYYCTKVINTGDYFLEAKNYFDMWNVDNSNNPEIIFAFNQSIANNGSNRLAYFPASRATQGSLTNLSSQGTDAYALTTRMYHMWDGHHNDPRFFQRNLPDSGCVADADYQLNRGIQVGPQYGIVLNDAGTDYQRCSDGKLKILPLYDKARSGARVDYTPEVGLTSHNEQVAGARPWKYEFDPMARTHNPSRVNIPTMRLADVYFMRAEAYLREGDAANALKDVNMVRSARGVTLDTSIDLKRMELERIWEFYYEFQRRRDQIRFGDYEDTWTDKTNTDPTRRLFPIPQDVIDAASGKPGYLEQNRGY